MCTSAFRFLWRERRPLFWVGLCLLGSAIYQLFGHGVTSLWMSLCFLPPLWFWLLTGLGRWRENPVSQWSGRLLGAGAATLAVGMFLQGVLDIAGSESPYLGWFYALGTAMLAAGTLAAFAGFWKGEKSQ